MITPIPVANIANAGCDFITTTEDIPDDALDEAVFVLDVTLADETVVMLDDACSTVAVVTEEGASVMVL